MKYQCLQCGAVISEKKESCPECSSNKLLSIEEPLNDEEREELLKSASKEITLLIQDVFVREKKEEVEEKEEAEVNEEWNKGIRVLKEGIYELNLENLIKSTEKEKGISIFKKKKKE